MLKRPQRYVYKINSDRFDKRDGGGLSIKIDETQIELNNEKVAIGESQVIRMIDDILFSKSTKEGKKLPWQVYRDNKKAIKELRKLDNSEENEKKIKKLHDEIDKALFLKEYIMIVFKNKRDYNSAVNKGVKVDEIEYKRLYGTTIGIKKNTIIFVSDSIHKELDRRLECDRDTQVKLVPAKYEAYKSLASSASVPIDVDIKPEEILVVEDHVTKFVAKATNVKPCKDGRPNIEQIEEMEFSLEQSDGNGIISVELNKEMAKALYIKDRAPTGYCLRSAFLKGMGYAFDWKRFVNEIVIEKFKLSPMVEDVWGNKVDARKVKMVIPTSMLKLAKAYSSIEDYISKCKENGFWFSVTKVVPLEIEHERGLTYQYLQSLNLTKDDIRELIKPTVKEFKDILGGDYRKAVLYLRGKRMREDIIDSYESDYIKALMIDDEMLKDPYVKTRIHRMIRKAIDDAKCGVVKVKGNYMPIAGDMYGLAEYIFGIKTNDSGELDMENGVLGRGLLGADEFYANYWNEKGIKEVVAFKAPMCTHANIRVLRLKDNDEVRKWYKHMPNCVVFNSWDSSCDSISGSDKDGDAILTTDNPIVRKGVEELPPLICSIPDAERVIVTEESIRQSNKNGFYNNVGKVTNRATSIRNKMAEFEKDSEEYQELFKREMAMQRIQQSVIDSIKTGTCEKVPKEWYSYHANLIIDDEYKDKMIARAKSDVEIEKIMNLKNDDEDEIAKKQFNMRILASRKPYFMSYVYNSLKYDYKQYQENVKANYIRRFGEEIGGSVDTDDKKLFVEWYKKKMPLDNSESVMNQLCWEFEREFDSWKSEIKSEDFDSSILKTEKPYSDKHYKRVKRIYNHYKKSVRDFTIKANLENTDKELFRERMSFFLNTVLKKLDFVCPNQEDACNIVIDMCYKSDTGKQFAWEIAGEQIVKNLLKRNQGQIKYFQKSESGDIEFNGDKFELKIKKVEM